MKRSGFLLGSALALAAAGAPAHAQMNMPGMFICIAAAGADTIAADEQTSTQRIFTTAIA